VAAGATRKEVSVHLFCDPSKISRIETGRVTPSLRDVRDLLQFYGVKGVQRDDLLRLAHGAREKEPWWRAYDDVPDVRTYVALEESAVSICSYESLVIPGLLQVEEYARVIIGTLFPNLGCEKVERLVEVRLRRQSLLRKDDPVMLRVVLDEAALHRMLSEREVMRGQLRYLIEAASMPTMTFQLLPFSAGLHPGMAGPFTILSFADAADRDIVYFEDFTGNVYVEEPDQLEQYNAKFEQLQMAACSPEESTTALIELAKSYDLELDGVELSVACTVEKRSPFRKTELESGSVRGL
jgi:hypothetical protein